MKHVQERLERVHAKVRETIATEAPGVPVKTVQATVCMPYPGDDKDMVFFYGEGVVQHADFDYATTRLSELLQKDGIETAFARVSRTAYQQEVTAARLADLPEQRFVFLAKACGCDTPPESILSCPLFSPAVIALTLPGTKKRARFLVV